MSASAGLTPAEISPGFSSVWKLAWPSITAFALQAAVGLVDLVFVAQHVGRHAVAADQKILDFASAWVRSR